jgi:hypothetical protein
MGALPARARAKSCVLSLAPDFVSAGQPPGAAPVTATGPSALPPTASPPGGSPPIASGPTTQPLTAPPSGGSPSTVSGRTAQPPTASPPGVVPPAVSGPTALPPTDHPTAGMGLKPPRLCEREMTRALTDEERCRKRFAPMSHGARRNGTSRSAGSKSKRRGYARQRAAVTARRRPP